MPSTTTFSRTPKPRHRSRSLAIAATAALAAVALATRCSDGPRPRLVVAVDATTQLTADERAALLEGTIDRHYAHDGNPVAVYRFGADGSEADELLPPTRRATCKGPSCASMWRDDARKITAIAAQTPATDATGSGILEATCSLPTRPGDTLLLLSDLTQRTPTLDLTAGNFSPDQVDRALATARDAGLICPQLRDVHITVVGFGSDGRSGTQAAGLRTFWQRLAREAHAASLDIERFQP